MGVTCLAPGLEKWPSISVNRNNCYIRSAGINQNLIFYCRLKVCGQEDPTDMKPPHKNDFAIPSVFFENMRRQVEHMHIPSYWLWNKYTGALLFASKQLLMLAHGCSSLQNCRTWQDLTHAHIPTTSIGTLTALCWLVLISPAKSLSWCNCFWLRIHFTKQLTFKKGT